MGRVAVLAGEVRAIAVGKSIESTTLVLPTDVEADPGDNISTLAGSALDRGPSRRWP